MNEGADAGSGNVAQRWHGEVPEGVEGEAGVACDLPDVAVEIAEAACVPAVERFACEASVPERTLRRLHPREEPSVFAAHSGICVAG